MGAKQIQPEPVTKPQIYPLLPNDMTLSQLRPDLSDSQLQILSSQHKFDASIQYILQLPVISHGNHFFQGMLDSESHPKGHGIYYLPNGAIFVGKFIGKCAENQLIYILPSGAHFQGNLAAPIIGTTLFEDPGTCTSFKGELKHFPSSHIRFLPHGSGSENSLLYSFQGQYNNGKKEKGRLVWTSNNFESIFEGYFDQNTCFTGQGVLTEQTGCYKGQFQKGLKHGKGRYEYLSKLVYQGEYFEGFKSGKGKFLNSDGSQAYEGFMLKGLPHGEGNIPSNGELVNYQFHNGLPLQYQQHLQASTLS